MCLYVATWFAHSEIRICGSGCIIVLAPCLCVVCGLLCVCVSVYVREIEALQATFVFANSCGRSHGTANPQLFGGVCKAFVSPAIFTPLPICERVSVSVVCVWW